MRKPLAWIALLLCCASACGEQAPAGPTPTPPPRPAPQPPPPPSFSDKYTELTAGDVVSHQVTSDDPQCAEFPPLVCLFYRVNVPQDGTLEVAMPYSLGSVQQVLDLSVAQVPGREIWASGMPLRVDVPALVGRVYQITVWYGTPGVQFQLRTSIRSS